MELRPYQTDLIQSTRKAFRNGRNKPVVVLPCGGGKTVCFAYMATQHIKRNPNGCVWFLEHRRELIEQTARAFETVPDNIFIGMVQTVSRNPQKYGTPTLIIFDECHHATAGTWLKIIEAFPTVPVVGLTATPARTDGTGLGKVFDSLIIGVGAEWLQNNGYLCQYDYYAPKLNIPRTFGTRGADFDNEAVADELRRSKIYGDVLKYIDSARKTIIYCPTIKYSQELAEQIPNAVHFDGNTPKAERDGIIKSFRDGTIRVLLNVDLIGEGFDVPDCDCVILLRPTLSTVLYIQQSMRCLRPAPNKRAIIYDMVGNCYRHGLPTEHRDWTLDGRVKARNTSGEPDITARQCKACYKVYSGAGRVCPYCGSEQPKNEREIEEDTKAELERIEAVERKAARRQVGMARTENDLIKIGKERGYKNPKYWAQCVLRGRR